MHIVGAILGAFALGIFWWLRSEEGQRTLHYWLDSWSGKKRAERAAKAREEELKVPLRSLKDARDAATAVMIAVAEIRGPMTDEQRQEIRAKMRTVLGIDDKLETHFSVAQHAARSVTTPSHVIDETASVFREQLNGQERMELVRMVEDIANLHGGATSAQESMVGRLKRSIENAHRDY